MARKNYMALAVMIVMVFAMALPVSAQGEVCAEYPLPSPDQCEEPGSNTPDPVDPVTPVADVDPEPQTDQLADTGLDTPALALIAVGFLVTGAGAVVLTRRRS